MLTAGRSVLRCNNPHVIAHKLGELYTFTGPASVPNQLCVDGDRLSTAVCIFDYIGERGDDGWITAPPGGWKENPFGDRRVEVLWGDKESSFEEAATLHWPNVPEEDDCDIIAARLVDQEGGQADEA